jgi:hypothetical protein
MSIEFGWQVATAVAAWLQQAIKAARNRRERRFAHIIGNAGIIVAGLRSIDREFHRLFLPLLYFDPNGWSEDKRSEWAERIIAWANEDVILPRMRAADSALEVLVTEETDRDVQNIIADIRHVRGPGPDTITSLLISRITSADATVDHALPFIIDALLGQDPGNSVYIRQAADDLIRRKPGLRRYADDAEQMFGRLMGLQQKIFPTLPAPTWVWEP